MTKNIFIALCLLLIIGCFEKSKEVNQQMNNNKSQLKQQQEEYLTKLGYKKVRWEVAKDLIIKEKVDGGRQSHTGILNFTTTNGEKLYTIQPKIDDYYRLIIKYKLDNNKLRIGTE